MTSEEAKAVRYYRMTRRTKTHVWLRYEFYGTQGRGLSMRMTVEDFKVKWLPCPISDALDRQLFFHRQA